MYFSGSPLTFKIKKSQLQRCVEPRYRIFPNIVEHIRQARILKTKFRSTIIEQDKAAEKKSIATTCEDIEINFDSIPLR